MRPCIALRGSRSLLNGAYAAVSWHSPSPKRAHWEGVIPVERSILSTSPEGVSHSSPDASTYRDPPSCMATGPKGHVCGESMDASMTTGMRTFFLETEHAHSFAQLSLSRGWERPCVTFSTYLRVRHTITASHCSTPEDMA